MTTIKRSDNDYHNITASCNKNFIPDGFITTLHPEGSYNNIKFPVKKRELVRPKINFWKASLNVIIPLFVFFVVYWWDVRFAMIGLCTYSLFRLRGMIIWCIRVYQRYAPEDIRSACVFEPSCSEYMILSIRKYGVIRGGIKGVERLKRCHLPNGGEDYP